MTRLKQMNAQRSACGRILLAVLGVMFIGACHHHHESDDRNVVVVDEHGYRHEGYYDADRHWHGGWYDEHNVRHEDPYDWRH